MQVLATCARSLQSLCVLLVTASCSSMRQASTCIHVADLQATTKGAFHDHGCKDWDCRYDPRGRMVLVASLKIILWAAIKSLEASRHHGGDVSPADNGHITSDSGDEPHVRFPQRQLTHQTGCFAWGTHSIIGRRCMLILKSCLSRRMLTFWHCHGNERYGAIDLSSKNPKIQAIAELSML